ncbi:MAG TPA: hypothetical protein VHA11_07320 [Bryobacteraceae bacterium]|nr:hypothetical protein [Bryobacteraceae bacterium]
MLKLPYLAATLLIGAAAIGSAAPAPRALSIVKATLRQYEGGPPVDAGFRFFTGDTLFFSFQVQGYQVSAESGIDLAVRIDALDSGGTKLMKTVERTIVTQVSAEDKDWMPVVRETIEIPPLALPGSYRIRSSVEDRLARQAATNETTFLVRGLEVEPSDSLVDRNFRFLRAEDDRNPVSDPVYRPGEAVWARFEMTGFHYGDNNRVQVSYGVAILGPAGNQMYSQPEAAVEQGESFYPKRYLPGVLSVVLNDKVKPGEYTLVLTLHDLAGNQAYESRHTFRVE